MIGQFGGVLSADVHACHKGAEYSTCWIIFGKSEHFLQVWACEKLSPYTILHQDACVTLEIQRMNMAASGDLVAEAMLEDQIDHFIVLCSVTRPLNKREAGVVL